MQLKTDITVESSIVNTVMTKYKRNNYSLISYAILYEVHAPVSWLPHTMSIQKSSNTNWQQQKQKDETKHST